MIGTNRIVGRGQPCAPLGVDPERVPIVTRDQVTYAKPDPDLFVVAAERLGARIEAAMVVGDDIWDMLAATGCRALGVSLLAAAANVSASREWTAVAARP